MWRLEVPVFSIQGALKENPFRVLRKSFGNSDLRECHVRLHAVISSQVTSSFDHFRNHSPCKAIDVIGCWLPRRWWSQSECTLEIRFWICLSQRLFPFRLSSGPEICSGFQPIAAHHPWIELKSQGQPKRPRLVNIHKRGINFMSTSCCHISSLKRQIVCPWNNRAS